MSKLAHSNDETMLDIEIDRRAEDGTIDEMLDRHRGLHFETAADKLISALKKRSGTSVRYPEVRALLRFIAKHSGPPDFLEVLEAVAGDICEFHCPSQWETAKGYPGHSDKCKRITAAIAKARGEPCREESGDDE